MTPRYATLLSALALGLATATCAQGQPIDFDAALVEASKANAELRTARIAVRIADTRPEAERGRYDWAFGTELEFLQAFTIQQVATQAPETRQITGSFSFSRFFDTGTQTTFGFSTLYRDLGADSSFIFPLPTLFAPQLFANVEQDLLRGLGADVNNTAIELAELEGQTASIQEEELASNVVSRLATAWVRALQAKAALGIRRGAVDVAKEQLDAVDAQIDAGQVARNDRVAVEQLIAARQAEVVQAENDYADSLVDIGSILGRGLRGAQELAIESDWPERIRSLPHPTLDEIEANLERTYAARTAKIGVERAQRATVQTENATLPDLSLTASVLLAGADENYGTALEQVFTAENPTVTVGLALALPIENRTAESIHAQALFEIQRAEGELEATMANEGAVLMRLARNLGSTDRLIAAADRSVELAQASLDGEKEKFQLGRATNLDVLQAIQTLEEAQLERAQLDSEALATAVQLHHQSATLLNSLGVELEREGARLYGSEPTEGAP